MITFETFSKNHLESIRKNFNPKNIYSKINPPLLEKMIRALALVEALVIEGLDFTFKGGTSLILILDRPYRLSIDADIITIESKEKVIEVLNKVNGNYGFLNFKEDERSNSLIPKQHFKFHFKSEYGMNETDYILLDVLYDSNTYSSIIEKDIDTAFLNLNSTPTKVKTPDINSITGDKLTTFAPNTTGIKFKSGKEIEIIKQIFDIGILFDKVDNLDHVRKSFIETAKSEIEYRKLTIKETEVLDDIVNSSLIVAKRENQSNNKDKEMFEEIRKGLVGFKEYTVFRNFNLEKLIETTSKAAYLAALIKTNSGELKKDLIPEEIKSINIVNQQYNFLNKLKKLPDNSSLFYWYETLKLLNLEVV